MAYPQKKRPKPTRKTVAREDTGKVTGRLPVAVDESKVFERISQGWTIVATAYEQGVSVDTLERRFADTLNRARAARNSSLQAAMYKKAVVEADPGMQRYLSKQWLGMRDKVEHVAKEEVVVKSLFGVDTGQLSAEYVERNRRREERKRANAGPNDDLDGDADGDEGEGDEERDGDE